MKDKTVLITGATSGIGKATALNLAKRGARLILVGRDRDRSESARYEILRFSDNNDIHLFFADLSLLSETRSFALSVKNVFPRIDVLINNAATIASKTRTLTKEHFETTLATNFLSPVVLSLELMDVLLNSPGSQIINVSSWSHKLVKVNWDNLDGSLKYNPLHAYGVSKLLLNTFSFYLASQLSKDSIRINCVDPGMVYTEIFRNTSPFFRALYSLGEAFMRPTDKGAASIIKMASDIKSHDFHGAYIKDLQTIKAAGVCYDKTNQQQVWQKALSMTGCIDPFTTE